ncbi:hypothetical protein ARMGADRAFT_950105, partial [Armillaria gallica]
LPEPFRMYAIVMRFWWEQEAELASKYTLCLSLYEGQHQNVLRRILTCSLVKLFAFHRKWWDEFGEDIEWDAGYRECGNSVDVSVWTALVWKIFSDMDARTPGVRPFSMEIKEWPEKDVCWPEKYLGCRNFAHDRLEVLERVRNSRAELSDIVQTLVRAVRYPSGFR